MRRLLNALDQRSQSYLRNWLAELWTGDPGRQFQLLLVISVVIHLVTIYLGPLVILTQLGLAGLGLTLLIFVAQAISPRWRGLWVGLFWLFWQAHATIGVLHLGGIWSIHIGYFFVCSVTILSSLGWRWSITTTALTACNIAVLAWAEHAHLIPHSQLPPDDWVWPTISFFMELVAITSLPLLAFQGGLTTTATFRRQNQLLNETQSSLREQQRQQTQFVASVSHELRTPMNAIMGFIQSIDQSTIRSESDRTVLELMENASEQLLARINELLDFSQLQAGKLKIRNQPIELHPLIESIANRYTQSCQSNSVAFDWGVDEDLPQWIDGDGDRLSQILCHLLGNAVKFTQQGSISMHVRRGDENTLEIEVTDTGPGIAASHLAQLFSPFSAYTSESRRKMGGTGLGLPITQALLKLMGGAISIHSELDIGTSMRIKLPLRESSTAVRPIQPLDAPDRSTFQNSVALVVDDSPINRMVAIQLIHRDLPGLTVLEASSGAQAIAITQAQRVNVILMDFVMPGMSGASATRKILSLHGDRSPTVLGVTGDVTPETHQLGINSGMGAIIHKPFTRETLIPPILRALEKAL